MEPHTSPLKNARSPGTDGAVNVKTSITCSNVPEGLFDANAAKKHFSKFGRVQKIRLFPRRQMCIIEYDQPNSVERAVLNAGAFDGFMFDVTRIKPKIRRRSKRDDDPDWVPNNEVEAELSAMGGTPTYRVPRQKPMEIESAVVKKPTRITRVVKQNLPNAKAVREKIVGMSQPAITNEPVVAVTALPTSISTAEAAADLHQLRSRVSFTPDEQWRTLDARDKILRSWGGAGSRIKVGGATIGTCPDMCPEKELLHRQAEHQVMTLETVQDSDGQLEPWRAVKQYSRSSADQEMPMCYELRPPLALMRTCSYLLHEIADTRRQVSLADWFHFMWDRFRGIRKDITQQALCCADSIQLVEMCARFHAHCAARLADLEHTQFDQKLNTDNLTKCLQTLKHMYADVEPRCKPREAEFRGYIALLNLGDANFWWEIKQLSLEIQKSEPIAFATQIFMALDNNNYIRFFRLIREKATYLQACILLRYFNDVRARALARIVKAFAPRGGSRYPAYELMNALAFESSENMQSFISHYGLRIGKEIDSEVAVILDRNQFIEDSDPYPISRSVQLIESKRRCTVGEVIAGGQLPQADYLHHTLYSSFGSDGKLKESALIAEDLGYDTKNDSNKDIKALMAEIQRLAQSGKFYSNSDREIPKPNTFSKPESKPILPDKPLNIFSTLNNTVNGNTYSFKPAIPIAPREIISNSPEKLFEVNVKNTFSFSKPQESPAIPTFSEPGNIFKTGIGKGFFDAKNASENKSIFGKSRDENMDPMQNTQNIFKTVNADQPSFSKKTDAAKAIFGQIQTSNDAQSFLGPNKNIFSRKDDDKAGTQNVFGNKSNLFAKPANVNEKEGNIFTKPALNQEIKSDTNPSNLFRTFNKPETNFDSNNIFAKSQNSDNQSNVKSIFSSNGEVKLTTSPGSLFKTANNLSGESAKFSLIPTTNKLPSEGQNIFSALKPSVSKSVYDFDENNDDNNETIDEERVRKEEEHLEKLRKEKEFIENLKRQEELKKQETKRQEELKKKEEERLKQEAIRKQEEQRRLKEKRKEDERRQEQLKKKLEEERKAELKKKAEEEAKRFQERVDKESVELVTELVEEVQIQTLSDLLKEEIDHLRTLVSYANEINQEILTELCDEICEMEFKAETFWSHKLMKKWFYTWKKQLDRNIKRRTLLEDTPVWLTDKTPMEEALLLRRAVENTALKNMNAIHKGYKFTGELKQIAPPDKYDIMELIKSPLLKRMKQINYAYDKCFFWKATIALPSSTKWLYRKVNMEEWILKAFSDSKTHDEASDTLIHVGRQSWNNLMDFAISVSFIKESNTHECSEAMDGTNGLLIYATEIEDKLINTIKETLRTKYPYQKVPVAIVMPQLENTSTHLMLEKLLTEFVNNGTISTFKIFTVQNQNISESLNCCTKSAFKWLARKYPECPPLQIDYLKSICQRYLGNEIWCMLRSHTDCRMIKVLKDLQKIVNCYNVAVDKLVQILTDEDLFNYPSFPLEFKPYINDMSPYPKPYEFIPSSVKSSENTNAIKDFMNKLKLPIPREKFNPTNVICMQDRIREYCNHIGWFEDPEEVACKVVALLPQELSDISMPHEEFTKSFEHYNLIDFLNIIVYEKIRGLNNFGNRFAIYKTSVLEDYRNDNWLNDIEVLSNMKHKAIECEDEIDSFIEAKRRKIAHDSLEYLMIEDKDQTMIDENIKVTNESIASFNHCEEAVKQLEDQLDEGKKKSVELEKLLRAALSNV